MKIRLLKAWSYNLDGMHTLTGKKDDEINLEGREGLAADAIEGGFAKEVKPKAKKKAAPKKKGAAPENKAN
jgi:hypothetical protein